jgi:hypothetical protein
MSTDASLDEKGQTEGSVAEPDFDMPGKSMRGAEAFASIG